LIKALAKVDFFPEKSTGIYLQKFRAFDAKNENNIVTKF
jgi:hypothetical protein